MNGICRLCFVMNREKMHALQNNTEILSKISTCFSIKLILEESLPKSICNNCFIKINDIYDFQRKIIETEHKLLLYLKNGELSKNILKKFNDELKSDEENPESRAHPNINIKEENSERTSYTENSNLSSDEDILPSTFNNQNANNKSEIKSKCYKNNKNINKTSSSIEIPLEITNNISTNKQFKCLTCFSIFESKIDLLTHYLSQHGEGKMNEEYTAQTIDGVPSYSCNKCNKVYEKRKSIVNHVITHQKHRPFTCNMCGRAYKTPAEIIRHGRVHSGDRLICPQHCGYTTVYRGAMKMHIRGHSEKPDYKYTCEKCGKGFNVKTWHAQHQNVHTGHKPFVCDICGLGFHMDRYLTSHRSAVHPQSSDVKRYVCLHCQLPCDTRRSLIMHMEVHGIKASFLCDICGKVVSSAEKLKYHERNEHLGLKPHTCSVCNKSFAKKFNLKLHERTHTGERAHACATCGKTYVQRSTLLRHHRRAHAKTQCHKCKKKFSTLDELGAHEKTCL